MRNFRLPHRTRRWVGEGSWIVVGQVLSVLGSLILVRVLTEYLNPTQYGELALGLTLAGLVNQVAMGGLIASVGRYYSLAAAQSDLPGYIAATRSLVTRTTGALVLATITLMLGLYMYELVQWAELGSVVLAYALTSSYSALLMEILNAARLRALVAMHTSADPWLRLAFAIGLTDILGISSTAVVVGYAVATLLLTVSQWFFLHRSLPLQPKARTIHNIWREPMQTYASPFSIWGMFTWAQQASDRWALQTFGDAASVGLYAVVFQFGYIPIGMLSTMVINLIGPAVYQRMSSAADSHCGKKSVHRFTWAVALVGLAVTMLAFLATFLLHRWLFTLLVHSDYVAASYLLPWTILAGGLFSVGQVLALKLMTEMRPASMTHAKVITAILGIIANVLGSVCWGIDGAVASLVFFSCIYLIWMAWLVRIAPSNQD